MEVVSVSINVMRRIVSLIIVFAFAIMLNAQRRTSMGSGLLGINESQIATALNVGKAQSKVPTKKDYALYLNITKKNGWFVGVGPQITDLEATYHSFYYRLSDKNPAGNWTHVEARNAYGKLTTDHKIHMFAIPSNNEDSGADSVWIDKLESMCQWYFTYDGRGERVTMETVCDANGNALCLFRPIQINDSTVIGTYLDNMGRPANLRKNDTGATLVRLTYDKNGYTSKIELLDGNGQNIKNHDEVYANRHVYDEDGYELSYYSIDPWGNMMMDKCQNCGVDCIWDKKNNVLLEQISFNDKHQYEKKPATSISDYDIAKAVYEYDEHKRQTAFSFYTVDGAKDTVQTGIHREETKLDRHGNSVETINYGIDGNLHNDYMGAARYESKFDDTGRCTLWASYDDKNNPVVVMGNSYARQEIRYDNEGNDIAHNYYSVADGKLILEEQYEKKGDTETYQWVREYTDYKHPHAMYKYYQSENPKVHIYKHMCGIINIDSLDSRGNIISEEYFDSLNHYVIPPGNYLHASFKAAYDYAGDNYKCTKVWRRDNGNIQEIESIEYFANDNTQKKMIWDPNNYPYSFIWKPSESCSDDWQIYLSPLGNPSRTEYDGTCCYKETMKRDSNGDIYAWGGVNEWGEQAYVTFEQGKKCYVQNNNGRFSDENSKLIDDPEEFTKCLPKVLSIECLNKKAFDLGFKDNDIIVQYGDYYYPIAGTNHIEDNLLALVMNANKEKIVRVLRHDVENKKSEIVTISLGEGTLSEFGVAEHVVVYTQKELKRLTAAITKFKQDNPEISWQENTHRTYESGDKNSIQILMPSKKYNSKFYYQLGIKDVNINVSYQKVENTELVTYKYIDCLDNVKTIVYFINIEDEGIFNISVTDEEMEKLKELIETDK